MEIVKKTKGFVSLSLSEPLKGQEFERYAWVSYDSDEHCTQAKHQLDSASIQDYSLNSIQSRGARKSLMITPELPDDTIERDLDLCQRLISEVFDLEKEIDPAVFDRIQDFAKGTLTPTQHLDLLLLYLRRVHGFCLYCGEEYDDERMLAAKCGPSHLRHSKRISRSTLESSDAWAGSRNFEDKYTRAARERLDKGVRELVAPSEDPLLKQMKEEYATKKC